MVMGNQETVVTVVVVSLCSGLSPAAGNVQQYDTHNNSDMAPLVLHQL
jgi:hypothetical protein